MSAFRQVRDLLQWVQSFHEQLGARYLHLADEQQDERMRMALVFLADREDHMRDSIATYLERADENLLETWLIDSQQFGHPPVLERIPRCMGCRDVYDVLANVLTAHQMLRDMYRIRAELAETPTEAELFEQLERSQEVEARLQARDLGRLEMY